MGAISDSAPALWLKADAITGLVDGDPVATWVDSSGNGLDATQGTSGNRPTYKTAIVNGLPVVRFDGSNDYLASSASGSGTSQTVIAVVKPTVGSTFRGIRGTSGSNGVYLRIDNDNRPHVDLQAINALGSTTNTVSTSNWHVIGMSYKSGVLTLRPDGVNDLRLHGSSTPTSGRTTVIGSRDGTAEFFPGDFAELISWNRRLTSTEWAAIESELNTKYALTPAATDVAVTDVTVTASTDAGGGWNPYLLFNGTGGGAGNSWSAGATPPQWVEAQLEEALVASQYTITARTDAASSAPSAWTFEGSNDNSTWDVLDTKSSQSFTAGQVRSFSISNTTAYTYYRLNMSATIGGGSTWPSFAELAFVLTKSSTTPVSLTGVTADVQVGAPAGTVAAGTKIPASLTGVTANVNVAAPAGTVTAGTGATPVSLTGVTVTIQVAAPAGTVTTVTGGAVALPGVPAGVQIDTPAGTVATGYIEWEQLESYTEAWATIRDQMTFTIDPVLRRPGYSLKVVDMQGDVVCELTEASIGTSTRTLNGRGGIGFTLPKLSPELAQVQQFSEVQLWRGGHLVPGGWYVVVKPDIDVNATTMGIQCSGLSYYFERRNIGGDTPELLLNGGFEQGPRFWEGGWSPGGTSGRAPDITITRDACEGGKALRIYGDSNGHRQFRRQGFTATNTHPTEPLWVDIQCQARIDDWDGPSKDGWLLYADVRPSDGSTTILYNAYTSVDETSPRDRWMPQSVRVKIPAATTAWVQVRLYPPHGSASFDQVSATADTHLLILKRDPWQAIQTLVEEAQDVSHGKSDLNIGSWGSWSGFKIDRRYPWKRRDTVAEAIDEIVRSRNGPDANMEVGARIRRLTVAPKQGARIGYVKPVFALGNRAGDARIVSYSAGIDGDEVVTTAYVQSSWSGGGMTEVVTRSARPDGLVLEKLYQTEQDAPTSTLLEQGRTALQYGRADVITQVIMHPDDTSLLMQQGITIGAVVTLDVHDGEVDVRADYRIVQIDLDPNFDQYTYTVVPEV